MVAIHEDAPLKWAALCKDYNPIHVSALAARLFGFPSMIAHGNQAAAMMVERLASTPQSPITSLWLDSSRASFMELEFCRPMVVPLQLHIMTADETPSPTSSASDEALLMSQRQIDAWAAEARLSGIVQQAAKANYQQVFTSNAFKDNSQNAVMAACIFIAGRDCKAPRTFSAISIVTHVPKKRIGAVYQTVARFLSHAQDETLQHFRLQRKDKVYVQGRIGWLGQKKVSK